MNNRILKRIMLLATCLALGVVVLGAYVRLSDAGLGCPDWPGCYGHLTVTQAEQAAAEVSKAYPDRPLVAHKAWKEMIHRYFASTLGLLIVIIAVLAWRRRAMTGTQWKLPLFLVVLVIFQGLLGMWTVTLLLKPVIVMLHLLGGMTTLSLLWWLYMRESHFAESGVSGPSGSLQGVALLGLIIVACQIALGGWTSANYAALACPDFPTCQNSFWPPMDFAAGFDPWHGLGIDYEGGILHNSARVAIHVTHRIGALVTLVVLLWLAIRASKNTALGTAGGLVMGAVILQFMLGIIMVVTQLPLPLAVAHNGIAALLLLAVVNLNKVVRVEN